MEGATEGPIGGALGSAGGGVGVPGRSGVGLAGSAGGGEPSPETVPFGGRSDGGGAGGDDWAIRSTFCPVQPGRAWESILPSVPVMLGKPCALAVDAQMVKSTSNAASVLADHKMIFWFLECNGGSLDDFISSYLVKDGFLLSLS